jgi:membrane fusion protein (multidrug efflux system)
MAKASLLRSESHFRSAQAVVAWTNDTTQSRVSAELQVADPDAELERARISLSRLPHPTSPTPKRILRTRQAANDRAQADLTRMKAFVDEAEISRLQYDGYIAGARVSESELQAAQERLASAVRRRRSGRQP